MKDTPISLEPVPLGHDDWQYMNKRSMDVPGDFFRQDIRYL